MKSLTKLLKNVSVICLILMFGFTSYSAVISDNDGSAFITKAEFESLKESFVKQINNYNESIDKKIDGAIASYLAGINMTSKTYYDIIYKDNDTKTINFMNGVIKPEFARPTMNAFNNIQIVVENGVGKVNENGSWGYRVNNAWTTNGTNRRPLLGLINGDEASPGDIYWRGVALRYHEYYEMASTRYFRKADIWPSGSDRSDTTHTIKFKYPCVTDYNGYNANIDRVSVNSVLSISYENSYAAGAAYTVTSWANSKFVNLFDAILETYNGEVTDHKKVIQYKGNTLWELSNENFNRTLRPFVGQVLTDASIYDARVATYNRGWYLGQYWSSDAGANNYVSKTLSWSIVNGTTPISSIGYVGDYAANNIYQTEKDITKEFSKSWEIEKITLEKGMPLCAANYEDSIEWEAHFSDILCFNEAPNADGSNYSTNENEVDIYLATKPFIDGISQDDNENYIKFKRGGTEYNYITTKNGIADIKFDMPRDGVVYMKAIPHWETTATYNGINDWWDLYLDIDGDKGQWMLTVNS